MGSAQFIRVHTYTREKAEGILAEADREEGKCDHVKAKKIPRWINGDTGTIRKLLDDYFAEPETVTLKNGMIANRKRRHDARCLIAGVVSHPIRIADISKDDLSALSSWLSDACHWLQRKFGNDVVVCGHSDESHYHFHFFKVGDPAKLHPGVMAEYESGKRLSDNDERMKRHKQGLRAFLDDFHSDVSAKHGLERTLNSRPAWRVRNRAVRAKLAECDKLAGEEIKKVRDELYDVSPKVFRKPIRF